MGAGLGVRATNPNPNPNLTGGLEMASHPLIALPLVDEVLATLPLDLGSGFGFGSGSGFGFGSGCSLAKNLPPWVMEMPHFT